MATSKKYYRSLLFLILPAFCIFFFQGSAFSAADSRIYTQNQFLLELDGAFAGFLLSVEGGNAVGEVVVELTPGYVKKKHLGLIKVEDIILSVGANMSKAFYQWIKDTAEQRYVRKNGAIVGLDYNFKEMTRIEFFNGLISEVTFPAADGASKEHARLQVKITPEAVRSSRSSGKAYPAQPMQKAQKNWLSSNYRFKIDGLDAATVGRTYKTSAPTIKIKMAGESVGEQRVKVPTPAGVEISNLTAWVAATHSEPLYQWFEIFVLKGNNADNMEKTGTLEYFDPSLKEVLFRLTFDHLGIFKLTRDTSGVAGGGLAYDKAEMYIENIRIDYSASR